MNRSFVVLAGATFIALALLLSTQIGAPAKISAPASQKQPHRVWLGRSTSMTLPL
jgi:hypothetical protein